MKTEDNTKDQKKSKYKYVTVVFRYWDRKGNTSHDVVDLMYELCHTVASYNNNSGYDGNKFDLYGVCVEDDSEIAENKNEFIKQIND